MNTKRTPVVVSSTVELNQALDAGYDPRELVVLAPDLDALAAKARQEGFAAGQAERLAATADGIAPALVAEIEARERTRVFAIQSLTERGLENVARDAIAQSMSVEQFALAQATAIKDRGITLAAIGRDAPPAAPFAGVSFEGNPAKRPLDSKGIFARRKESKGKAAT
jgi:hypothetical protein